MKQNFSQKGLFLVSALVAATCLVLIIKSQLAALVIHFLLGKFLYSTSNAAIIFLLVLYVVAALTVFISPVLKVKPACLRLWLLPAVLLFGNLINIWSFFVYCKQLDLPIKTHFYHWFDNQNSFCYLLHNHTGKTALSFLVQVFGIQDQMAAFDTGQVFSSHVSEFVPWLLTALLFLALGIFFFCLVQISQRYQHNVFVFLLFFLSFAGCLKSMVDGGPLTYRFFPSLLVIMSLVSAANVEELVKLWRDRWGIVFIVGIIPLITLWQYLSPERWTSALAPFLFLCFSFLLLFLLSMSHKRRFVCAAIVLIAMYLLLSIGVEFLFFDAVFFQKIGPDNQVIKVDFDTFTARDVSTECQGLKVYDAYLQYGNDPFKPDSLFMWNAKDSGVREMCLLVKPLEYVGEHGRIPLQDILLFQRAEKVESPSNALLFSVVSASTLPPIFSSTNATLFSRNNHYCYLHLLGHLFTASGLKEFVLIPLAGASP